MYNPAEQCPSTGPCPGYATLAVETLSEQGSGRLNEDVLLHSGNLFGVFDGATSLAEDKLPSGTSGGLLAARIAAEAFQQRGNDLRLAVKEANRRIGEAIRTHGISQTLRHRFWSTSLAVIRIDENHFDYCQTGDSLIFCLYQDGSYMQLTPETDHDQETLEIWKRSPLSPNARIHDTLAEQILAVRLQMNVTYGVLNGEPEAMNFVNHGRQEMDGVSAILIFTDGLFIPRECPRQQSDWNGFAAIYRKGGLRAIRDHIRFLQSQDPDCRTYPRFKHHDDIAAIAIRPLRP